MLQNDESISTHEFKALRDIIEEMRRFLLNSRLLLGTLLILITLESGSCSRETKPGPVILITIDTLRADHLGFSGYARDTSPFLDTLAAKGANFAKTMASSSHTAPSHASIFTGLQPPQHRVLANGQTLSSGYLTLAELFKTNGYETAAFTSVAFLRGLRKGFDFFDVPDKGKLTQSKFQPAKLTISKAIQWLAQRSSTSEQLFLWVHLYDVHQSLPEFKEEIQHEYLRQVKQGIDERRWIRSLIRGMGHKKNIVRKKKLLGIIDRYDAQILNVDTEIRRLYDAVKATKRFKNAMWIITSDHGEGLGNHNYLGHGERIYQEQLRVPLLFHFADVRYNPQKIQHLVRHVDLLPTVAELMKWKTEDQVFPVEGVSLAPLIRGETLPGRKDYAFAQRRPPDENWRSDWEKGEIFSLQTSRYKYIEHTGGQDEFYDLQSDPFELNNLSAESKEKEHLKKSLMELYGKFALQARSISDKPGAIEKEYLEELKALGYIN